MTITVHHLKDSRSHRILWLLEELGHPYEVVAYARDPVTRFAPPELKAVHPLGKSPVITDGDLTIAESGAITDYLIRTHGGGRFMPADGTREAIAYQQWLHFAEGSAMLPLLLWLYVGRLGEAGAPLHPRITGEIANHLGYMEASLGTKPYFMGDALTGADIMLSFVTDAAGARGFLADYPMLQAFAKRVAKRPAYQRAIERGGPYQLLR